MDEASERRDDAAEGSDEDGAKYERPGHRQGDDEDAAPPPEEQTKLPLSSSRSTPELRW